MYRKWLLYTCCFLSLLLSKPFAVHAQQQSLSFDTCLARGKAFFKLPYEDQDYVSAVEYLEQAVALQPANMEAHYFLGYAYSRLNAKDASYMPGMLVEYTWKVTRELQTVIRATPKYTGEIVVLDPYMKLTGEWGSMALCYEANGKIDSVHWALQTGKQQGAFGDFPLANARNRLDNCSKNALLFSSGDGVTLPLYYVQQQEQYRTDVTVIDISMLSTGWYPALLASRYKVNFGIPADTIQAASFAYATWHPGPVIIQDKRNGKTLRWKLKSSLNDDFLLGGERLFLSLLQTNAFARDVFFTTDFPEDDLLGMPDAYFWQGPVKKLTPGLSSSVPEPARCKTIVERSLSSMHLVNRNSDQEMLGADMLRYYAYMTVNYYAAKNKQAARELLLLIDRYMPEKTWPLTDNDFAESVLRLRRSLL
jgi:hypothetical protein